MKLYAAPMEGITGYIYRDTHRKYYGGIDRYFSPFLTPKQGKGWTSREKNDVLPAHNAGIPLVPQILTNKAEDFLRMTEQLHACGYKEVNLNLGCPSGTVVAKGKGCGFLADREKLTRFFEDVFARVRVRVSVKTRLGMEDAGEIEELMEIYNRFPFSEVIIHARIYRDFYEKPVNREAFFKAFLQSEHPVCYNGDIFTVGDFTSLIKACPPLDRVMLGRGLIANPQLAEQIAAGPAAEGFDRARWKAFHDALCLSYEAVLPGERPVLFKMKELWNYWNVLFADGVRYGKKIRKCSRLSEYKALVEELFHTGDRWEEEGHEE